MLLPKLNIRFPIDHFACRVSAAIIVLLITLPVSAMTPAEIAMVEYDKALTLSPNLENGRILYSKCAVCHDPEGWGRQSGAYPQIAGQLPNVTIKQLADIRAGNRGNPMMYPFASGRILQSAQDITDVAAYVSQLPMTGNNGKGLISRADHGKPIYKEYCEDCHGKQGEGDNAEHIPLIQGQHFQYLVRQFNWIRIGRRMNADEDMVEQIQNFHAGDMYDVLSYVSYLRPSNDKLTEDNWQNPDFPWYSRNIKHQYRNSMQKLSQSQNSQNNNAFANGANQ